MAEEVKQERRQEVAEDIAKNQRSDRQALRKNAEVLQGLMAHPGWKVFHALVAMNAQNHMGTLQRPLKSPDEVMGMEYAKGTLNGLSSALMIPQGIIDEAKNVGVFNDPEPNVTTTPTVAGETES